MGPLFSSHRRWWAPLLAAVFLVLPATAGAQISGELPATCLNTVKAHVVALDQPFFWNRLGAVQPHGMIFALRRDVVPESDPDGLPPFVGSLVEGKVMLRRDKRPRPLVLRVNAGDCLLISFQNLLNPVREQPEQPNTRHAGVHVNGLQLVSSIQDDASFVGRNPNSLAAPGEFRDYLLYAEREGQYMLYSSAATTGGDGDGGQLTSGLFGAVIVEPQGARWYRSQVTNVDLRLATTNLKTASGPITAPPQIDYEARYPATDPHYPNVPILNMLDGNEIIHSDLTAIIAGSAPNGPREGFWPPGTFPSNKSLYPERNQPFREYTLIYHGEPGAVQAFPVFNDEILQHTLHSVRDAFGINYGTGGIGAEILANRFKVGPMHDCTECKYEEFFLTSWAVGDPAMVVDIPANAPCTPQQVKDGANCLPDPGPKATKALYPDDPSNVYHSYLRDHVKMRILHGGPAEHHIHHLHAHQWVYAADSDRSTYLDSQAIGPGAGFTLDIAYHGSGNRNLTPGDSIFHCHFYPHFAMGMWSLWRVHDTLEVGTVLDKEGRPVFSLDPAGRVVTTARSLPDSEIPTGTPIPAVVPLPGKAMAPMPAAVKLVDGDVDTSTVPATNPGYPFYIPGKAGHRPPHPPLDLAKDPLTGQVMDGGLRRHIIVDGSFVEHHTRLDFSKNLEEAKALFLPEGGTAFEQVAMGYHAQQWHPSVKPNNGAPASFETNGLGPISGAPYADPCDPIRNPRINRTLNYRAANIELDVVLNKKGWHFPQQRMLSLWRDVDAYRNFGKPPEPFFFRANTYDCIEYWHTNLVPFEYELDDFQVRTPTDILGQHIHLVKFDVTSSDGSGNGWNYEDGTFSPGEVRERIDAIRAANGCIGNHAGGDPRDGTDACPVATLHPFFNQFVDDNRDGINDWLGAQTTIQRWFADDTLDNNGEDRTLRTVFTHDHFGPSTHQQAGLYAGLVVEEEGSKWFHNESGDPLGVRDDGGPTSWQAIIEGPKDSFREFMFEFADFQLAYYRNEVTPPLGPLGWSDPPNAVNPPGRMEATPVLPKLVVRPEKCPINRNDIDGHHLIFRDPTLPDPIPPCPEAISADDVGTMSVNYRNEPIASRINIPGTDQQALGSAGDLSKVYSSVVTRVDPELNIQPAFYQPLTRNVKPKDPYTPLLQAYEHDKVQIRVLVGAHEEGHNFTVHGIKWLFEPAWGDSGFRNSQMMGISEHFEFVVPQLVKNPQLPFTDYLYAPGAGTDDQWNGLWGIFRVYSGAHPDLATVSTNPNGRQELAPGELGAWSFSCPKDAPLHSFKVTAVTAAQALPAGRITYLSRSDLGFGPLHDPNAILYVRSSDLDASGRLLPGVPVEPLVLRARAGECIEVALTNNLPERLPGPETVTTWGYNTLPMIIDNFNNNDIRPSSLVGLHPQLVFFDASRDDGADIGLNDTGGSQLVPPGQTKIYHWYAGDVQITSLGKIVATPVEFGATNLISSDRIKHAHKGAIGSLIIEPEVSKWAEDTDSRNAATVKYFDPHTGTIQRYREFVLQFQNDLNLRISKPEVDDLGQPVENLADSDDPEDSGQKGLNYRTEPLWHRMAYPPDLPLELTRDFDFTKVLSNSLVGGDPETPIFEAQPGDAVRIRLLQSGGHARNEVFSLHGHVWEREPYIDGSRRLGNNKLAFWEGARMGHGPTNHFDVLLANGAGGKFNIPGDYLFRDFRSFNFDAGMWGLLRVDALKSATQVEPEDPLIP